MDTLKLFAIGLALFAATPAAADPARTDPVLRWRVEIAEASARFGVPMAWIARVMRAESGGKTTLAGRPITSPAGAMGLMQLMPATWAELRATYALGADPYDPHDNIIAGAAYLRAMYDRFGYPGLFAAYNAGPGRYADHLASGRALPNETRTYVAMVAESERAQAPREVARAPAGLFVVRATAMQSPGKPSGHVQPSGLFVSLSSDRPDR